MRIGVDADGVLADFDRGWVDRYNADFGTDIQYKDCDHWDSLVSLTNLSYDEWWEWVTSKHQDLFVELEPLPGAVEGVRTLASLGHEICIITAKPRWAAGHISNWLLKHDVPYDEIHVTNKKTFVACDVYVDDALHNCEAFLAETDSLVIQYAAWPYVNGGVRVPGAFYATSWDEIVGVIKAHDYMRSCEFVDVRRALQEVFR